MKSKIIFLYHKLTVNIYSLINIMFASIALELFLVIGGDFQDNLFKYINGNSSNLYESIYSDDFVVVVSIGKLLLSSINLILIITSLLIIIITSRSKNIRSAFIRAYFSCVTLLSLSDALINKLDKFDFIIQTLVANAIGGFIVATMAVAFVFLISKINKESKSKSLRILSIPVFILFSILFAAIDHYLNVYFFNTTTIATVIETKHNIQGYYYFDSVEKKDNPDSFRILSPNEVILKPEIYIFHNNFPQLKITPNDDKLLNAYIYYTDGCLSKDLENIKTKNNKITTKYIQVSKSETSGWSSLTSDQNAIVKADVKNEKVNSFIIQNNNDTPTNFDIQRFVIDNDVKFNISNTKSNLILSPYLAEENKHKNVNIKLSSSNNDYDITINKPNLNNFLKSKLHCTIIPITKLNNKFDAKTLNINIVISFSTNANNLTQGVIYNYKGLSGSLSVNNIDDKNLYKIITSGYVNGLDLFYNIKKNIIENQEQSVNDSDVITIRNADIYASIVPDVGFNFSGKAGTFYKNKKRLNQTLFEKTSTEVIVCLITLFMAFFTWLVIQIHKFFQKNEDLDIWA